MAGEPVAQPMSGEPAAQPAAAQPAAQPNPKAYLEYFPEDLRTEKTLEKFSGTSEREVLAKLGKSYVNLEKHAGGAIRLPGENATKDEIAAFRTKLGVPEKPEGYGIAFADLKVPEGVGIDEAGLAGFLAWAHEVGFTKTQTSAMIDRFVTTEQARLDATAQGLIKGAEAGYVEIKKDWGALTDRNLALVQRGVKEFFGAEFATWLEETGAGNDPRFLRGALKTFQPMMEDGLIKGENLGMRQADAATEIQRLMASKEFTSDKASERMPVVEKIRELSAIAYSGAV